MTQEKNTSWMKDQNFAQVPKEAFLDKRLSHTLFKMLGILCLHADKNGRVDITQARMAEHYGTGLTKEGTVNTVPVSLMLKELEKLGWVKRNGHKAFNGNKTYELKLPVVPDEQKRKVSERMMDGEAYKKVKAKNKQKGLERFELPEAGELGFKDKKEHREWVKSSMEAEAQEQGEFRLPGELVEGYTPLSEEEIIEEWMEQNFPGTETKKAPTGPAGQEGEDEGLGEEEALKTENDSWTEDEVKWAVEDWLDGLGHELPPMKWMVMFGINPPKRRRDAN